MDKKSFRVQHIACSPSYIWNTPPHSTSAAPFTSVSPSGRHIHVLYFPGEYCDGREITNVRSASLSR